MKIALAASSGHAQVEDQRGHDNWAWEALLRCGYLSDRTWLVEDEAKRRRSDGVAALGAELPPRLGAREPESEG